MARLGDLLGRIGVGSLVPLANDLGPNQPVRGGQVHPDRDQADTSPMPPFGASGTLNYKGYLQPSEYNSDLQRFAAIDVYERMRRSDPSVRETLWHMFGPIINAVWTIEPPDDPSDEEREQAEMVRAALFEWLEQPWVEVLEHALSYLTFGHSVFEPIFQAVTRSLTIRQPTDTGDTPDQDDEGEGNDDDDGSVAASELPSVPQHGGVVQVPVPLPPDTETKVLPPRQFTTWRKFSPRLPKTLWKWNVDEYSDLESVTQTTWVTLPDGSQGYRVVDIPAENLMIFTHEKWGDEWTGISLLRSAYKPWVMKEMIEKIAGVAYERHGVGYLIGYIPRERENDANLRSEMGQMLQELRQDAYAVMPGPKQMGAVGAQGYLVEILTPPNGIPNFEPILTYYRGEIAGAMLARFKELGHASTGARATADVQSAVWYNALHACARYVESRFNVAIRQLVDLNYTGATRYPKLKAAGIEARNLLEFAQAVALLVDAEILAPDLSTRQWARASIDAPREDLQETRARAIYDAQRATADAAQEVAQGTALANAKASAAPRGNETSSSENGGRPRVSNAAESLADAIIASNEGNLSLLRETLRERREEHKIGERTAAKIEKLLDEFAAEAREHPPTVHFADGAFHVEVAAAPAPNVEVHVEQTPDGPKTRRIHRDSDGNITRITEE